MVASGYRWRVDMTLLNRTFNPVAHAAQPVAGATLRTFDKKPMQKEGLQKQALKAWDKSSGFQFLAFGLDFST